MKDLFELLGAWSLTPLCLEAIGVEWKKTPCSIYCASEVRSYNDAEAGGPMRDGGDM